MRRPSPATAHRNRSAPFDPKEITISQLAAPTSEYGARSVHRRHHLHDLMQATAAEMSRCDGIQDVLVRMSAQHGQDIVSLAVILDGDATLGDVAADCDQITAVIAPVIHREDMVLRMDYRSLAV